MIEIVEFDQLKVGDTLLIESMKDGEVLIVTVAEIDDYGCIIPAELGGMDYQFDDPDQIVRVGKNGQEGKTLIQDLRQTNPQPCKH